MKKKALSVAVIVFVVFWVSNDPQGAAAFFKTLGGGILDLARGFGDFFSSLAS